MVDVLLAAENFQDFLDVARLFWVIIVRHDVRVGGLLVEILPGRVDELDGRVGFVLGQHQDRHRDGRAIEKVGGERDHRLDIVVIDQILPDLLLRAVAVEDPGETYDCRATLGRQVAKRVQHKGKIGL